MAPPMVETRSSRDLAWYNKMEEKLGAGKAQVFKSDQVGVAPKESQWQGYDFADDMEGGVARGSPMALLQPPCTGAQDNEQRLIVQRSEDHSIASLKNDAGETLLMAKTSADGCRFDIYASRSGAPPLATSQPRFGKAPEVTEPVFALVSSGRDRKEWVLMSLRCPHCVSLGRRRCGSGHHARIVHYVEAVGNGQAFCMDVEFPERRPDGSRAAICEACEEDQASAVWSMELTSRRPRWNAKKKTLTLDFRGRVSMASAKNSQLESPACPSAGKSTFLFGKVAEQKFVLDYSPPLGMLQAFAVALSTSHWQ